MKLKRVLIVYKKSSYAIYTKERKDKRIRSMVQAKDPAVRYMIEGHKNHTHTLREVQKILTKRGIDFRLMFRAAYFNEEGWDMVLSVGGDGTFMEAAHRLRKVPLLGLNSNPSGSVGFFCGARLDNLPKILDQIENDELKPVLLSRLELRQGKKYLGRPILNDVLIANMNPAATSRIGLKWGKRSLNVKCSGIWISSAAGSTGATRSAGAEVLPLTSPKFQMVIREPYLLPGDRTYPSQVEFSKNATIHLTSQMREGAIYIDGAHHSLPFTLGDTSVLQRYPYPLRVLGYDVARRKKLEP